MQIAILGGTGDLGEGLALRWAADTDHEIVVGSRDAERATAAARRYRDRLANRSVDASIRGAGNADAATTADVVVAAVPAAHVQSTIRSVAADLAEDAILVSPAVGIEAHAAGFRSTTPDAGSVTAVVAEAAPPEIPVVGAFHSVAAGRLAALDAPLSIDTLVVGDDRAARRTVADLAASIDGLRAIDAGPLANAAVVESLTALQLTLMRQNPELDDVGVRFR